MNIAFGLVAPEYGGGCADLKGLGGSGYQGSVGIVVKKEGHEGPERWEALSKIPSQRRSNHGRETFLAFVVED